jgi:hypothetical protein
MALSSPGAPSTMRNSGRRSPRLMRSSRAVRQASVLSPRRLRHPQLRNGTAVLSNYRDKILNRLSGLSSPVRITISATSIVLGAIVIFWLFHQIFYYLMAKSYADSPGPITFRT